MAEAPAVGVTPITQCGLSYHALRAATITHW
jgi:hypothetical protein